ncbi:hypothetical protein A1F94_010411 [Pyrenophora tritici-repentis]|nr:hypothetical protein PtrV1_11598 [Pyrenophora tritici-repentis]KAF7444401.1 hypothetical protein A1F99_109540 [Pyrenophora tritici-repentis]KAG9378642.1 hypothetical protein A1F94_010411 [Pyrenophora tritici-repentis]
MLQQLLLGHRSVLILVELLLNRALSLLLQPLAIDRLQHANCHDRNDALGSLSVPKRKWIVAEVKLLCHLIRVVEAVVLSTRLGKHKVLEEILHSLRIHRLRYTLVLVKNCTGNRPRDFRDLVLKDWVVGESQACCCQVSGEAPDEGFNVFTLTGWGVRVGVKPRGPAQGAAGAVFGDDLDNPAPAEGMGAAGEIDNLVGYIRNADACVDGAPGGQTDAALI